MLRRTRVFTPLRLGHAIWVVFIFRSVVWDGSYGNVMFHSCAVSVDCVNCITGRGRGPIRLRDCVGSSIVVDSICRSPRILGKVVRWRAAPILVDLNERAILGNGQHSDISMASAQSEWRFIFLLSLPTISFCFFVGVFGALTQIFRSFRQPLLVGPVFVLC